MKLVFSRRLMLIPAAIVALLWSDASTAQGPQAVNLPRLSWCYKYDCNCPDNGGSCSAGPVCNFASHDSAAANAASQLDTCCMNGSPPDCIVDVYPINSPLVPGDTGSDGSALIQGCVVIYTCTGIKGGSVTAIGRGSDLSDARMKADTIIKHCINRDKFGGLKHCSAEIKICGDSSPPDLILQPGFSCQPYYSNQSCHSCQPCDRQPTCYRRRARCRSCRH